MTKKLLSLLLVVCTLLYLSVCQTIHPSNNATSTTPKLQTDMSPNTNEITQNDSEKDNASSNSENTTEKDHSQTQAQEDTTNQQMHIHSYLDATCTTPKRCACGVTAGTAIGHNYSAATCTSPQICVRCGISQGDPLGHKYIEATCTSPKICERCSNVADDILGHNYVNEKCTRCGKLDRTYLIEDIEVFSESSMIEYATAPIQDNCSNTYSGHYTIHSSNLVNGGIIKFEVGKKYSKFSGTAFLSYKDRATPYGAHIAIYGDDRLLYQTNLLKEGSMPENFTIDITGVSILKIDFENYSGVNHDAAGYLTNAYLSK